MSLFSDVRNGSKADVRAWGNHGRCFFREPTERQSSEEVEPLPVSLRLVHAVQRGDVSSLSRSKPRSDLKLPITLAYDCTGLAGGCLSLAAELVGERTDTLVIVSVRPRPLAALRTSRHEGTGKHNS
jgi:hypothetical protein